MPKPGGARLSIPSTQDAACRVKTLPACLPARPGGPCAMSRSRPGPCARKTLHRRAGRGAPLAVAVEEPPNEPMKNWEERARFMDAFDACCLYELDPSDIALCARTCCRGRRSNGDQEYSVQHVRAWSRATPWIVWRRQPFERAALRPVSPPARSARCARLDHRRGTPRRCRARASAPA